MATRAKTPQSIEQIQTGDPWRQVSEPLEMANGVLAIHWRNTDTGQTRIVPAGMHPDDQALESYAMTAPDEPEEETATDRVAAMLSNVTGSPDERAEVKVYRVRDGALEYCRGFKPDEFENGNFDMLRDRYGAGEYELRLYATNPVSRKFVVRNKLRVTIAAELMTTPDTLGGGMGQVLATIAQGQAQMLEALVSIKQAPAKDPMEEMTKMLSMMTMMREAMGLNNQSASREKSSIGEIVSAIRELRGAADELSPEKKEPDSLMAMLPQVLDLVSKGQQSQAAPAYSQPLPPVQVPQAFAQQPQPQPQPQAETQEGADMKALTMLKLNGYLKTLVTMAVDKKTIDEGAAFVYEKLPDELIEIMALENWFDLLCAVASPCKDHKDWLTAVRDKALTMFEPE